MDAKIRHEKDTNVLLRREADRLRADADRAERGGFVDRILRLAEKCEVSAQSRGATLDDLATMYSDMKARHPDEYARDTASKGWRWPTRTRSSRICFGNRTIR